ncbi:unnamed protein product [Auanema sp. JU1783]|nr:unnamed protein product [Auanema sp. JU1783]
MYQSFSRCILSVLYINALFFSVPLSLIVWYVRRELVSETGVAGDDKLGGISAKPRIKDANQNFEVCVVDRASH